MMRYQKHETEARATLLKAETQKPEPSNQKRKTSHHFSPDLGELDGRLRSSKRGKLVSRLPSSTLPADLGPS